MARTVTLRISAGKPFPEWCDRCLVTHMWVRIYNADRPTAPPLATAGMHEKEKP